MEHNHGKSLDALHQTETGEELNQCKMSLCLMCMPVKCEICINAKQCINFEVI